MSVYIDEDERIDRLADTGQVTGQRQRAVLEHTFPAACLRRADQLLPINRDLVRRGHLETDRVGCAVALHPVLFYLDRQTQILHCCEQSSRNTVITFQKRACYDRFIRWSGDGVG